MRDFDNFPFCVNVFGLLFTVQLIFCVLGIGGFGGGFHG